MQPQCARVQIVSFCSPSGRATTPHLTLPDISVLTRKCAVAVVFFFLHFGDVSDHFGCQTNGKSLKWSIIISILLFSIFDIAKAESNKKLKKSLSNIN